MPFMDHSGRALPQESGERHEMRYEVDPRRVAVVLNSNIIGLPLDVSAFGLGVLIPAGHDLPGTVAVRLIVGEAMRMAQGSMEVVSAPEAVGADGAVRIGLQVSGPGPLADMLKELVAELRRGAA